MVRVSFGNIPFGILFSLTSPSPLPHLSLSPLPLLSPIPFIFSPPSPHLDEFTQLPERWVVGHRLPRPSVQDLRHDGALSVDVRTDHATSLLRIPRKQQRRDCLRWRDMVEG